MCEAEETLHLQTGMEFRLPQQLWLTVHFLLPLLLSSGRTASFDNVDRLEPIVRLSPDAGNEDQFGFAVVLHQIETPLVTDSATESASKTL